jgi:hypothetical protein
MILGTYDESYGPLLEDQWLLKIREGNPKTGFLSKLTKKGEIPVKFNEWASTQTYNTETRKWDVSYNTTVYVWQESYRSGWTLKNWRIGKSQEWAVMQHPEGFLLEIYLSNFLEVSLKDTADFGVLRGEYKWEDNRLYKKP